MKCTLGIVCLSLAAGSMVAGAVDLVRDGRPAATIVLSPDATEGDRAVAQELVRCVHRASGATLPVATSGGASHTVIFVGQNSCPEQFRAEIKGLSVDGFLEKVLADGRVILAGQGNNGTAYAVSSFLERNLGVRWLWPGDLGEVIPSRKTVSAEPYVATERPAYVWRALGPEGALWGLEDKWEAERRLGVTAEHQAVQRQWEQRNRFGGTHIFGGHAWGVMVPPSRYGKSNPEYYALVKGKRDSNPVKFDGKHGRQLCTSNPEVITIVADYVRKFLTEHPHYTGVNISPNDGRGHCECRNCRQLDSGEMQVQGSDPETGKELLLPVITDRLMTFANKIAARIEREHPDKLLMLLAYNEYRSPPKNVRPHKNVIIQFTFDAATHWNLAAARKDYEAVEGWTRHASRLGIYEYFARGSVPDLPRLVPEKIQDSVRRLHGMGFRYYQTQHGDGYALNGFNYYLLGRLLWDPKVEWQEVLADYVSAGFGKAAPAIERYLRRNIEQWRRVGGSLMLNTAAADTFAEVSAAYPKSLRRSARADLDEGLRLATGDERTRVQFLIKGLDYLDLTMDAIDQTLPLYRTGWVTTRRSLVIPEHPDWAKFDAALAAWEKRDRIVQEFKNTFVGTYLWILYHEQNRDFIPLSRLREAKALRRRPPPAAGAKPAEAVPANLAKYSEYLRDRIENRANPKIGPGFPASPTQWDEFERGARQKLRKVFQFPATDHPLNARLISRTDFGDHILEKIVYYTEPFSAVPAHLYIPKKRGSRAPGMIFACGHGGSKSVYYSQYAAQLYARAGVICLVPDPPGEEERDEKGRLWLRGHRLDFRVDRGLAAGREEIGKFVYDLVRGVDYLCSRPEVDPARIATTGHSLGGTLAMYLTAVDRRIRVSMPSAWTGHFGENAIGLSCCWRPYDLMSVGDQPELVALGAAHCSIRLQEGEVDYDKAYQIGRERTYRGALAVFSLYGRQGSLELAIEPKGGHRPYYLMPAAVAWVCRHLGPLNWTPEEAATLPTVLIKDWAARSGVELAATSRHPNHESTAAVDIGAIYHDPGTLQCLRPGETAGRPYSLQSWFDVIEASLPPKEALPATEHAWAKRRVELVAQLRACLRVPAHATQAVAISRRFETESALVEEVKIGDIGLAGLVLQPRAAGARSDAVVYLDRSRTAASALTSSRVQRWLSQGILVFSLDTVPFSDSAYLIGESATAHNIAIVQRALTHIVNRPGWGPARVTCHSEVDDVGLLSAILDDRIQGLTIGGKSGDRVPGQGYRKEGIVPGLARVADRATLLALVAPRPVELLLKGEPDALARHVYKLSTTARPRP